MYGKPAERLPSTLHRRRHQRAPFKSVKGDGLGRMKTCPGWWECSLAAISQTTIRMHGHHEATLWGWLHVLGLAGMSLGRELRALALSHTASVRRGTA